ncbi:MAG: BMP family protein [Nitrospinota bacterium]
MRSRRLSRAFLGVFLAFAMAVGFLAGPAAAAKKIRVAYGSEGPINDNGWYEGGYKAALKLKEEPGVNEVTFQERVQPPDLEGVLRRWALAGYNIIFGHGFEWGEPALKVASSFPDTLFAIAGFFKTEGHPNVITYLVEAHETGYLGGVLATQMSKTKKIGIIGGFPVPPQIAEVNGYKLGARSVDPKVKVVHVFTNDWFDASKAKEATIAMIDQGVDVVQVIASPMGFGGIKAAEERGKFAIGIYRDLNWMAPDTIISSAIFVWHTAMKQIILDMREGKVKKLYLVGVPEGGAKMAPFNKKVPPEVAKKVQAIEADIRSGKVKVPNLSEKLID